MAIFKPIYVLQSKLNNVAKIAGQFIITTDSGNIYFDLTSTDRKLIANKYTLPAATTSSLGGIKSGDALSVDSSGNVSIPGTGHTHVVSGITDLTVSANEINLLKGVTSNVQTQLNSKVNNTLTINSKPLTSNIQLTSSDVGAVPTSRKINNKALSTDISLTASDVSAIPTSSRAAANGVASLDSSKKIPISQIPAIFIHGYYSGGKFYSNSSLTTLITGEENKLYADLTSKGLYLYKDGAFVEVGSTLKLGTTSTTAFRGDYGNTAYTHATNKGSAFNSGLYKITTNSQGHVTAATAVVKSDITGLGIPGQDTTYTAGTGLSLSNGAFSLSTSGVTAGTKGPTANVTGTSAAAIKIPRVTVDSYGRITNLQEYTYTSNSASTVTPKANGSATVGTDSGFARGDHVHPLQTTVSGNAGTATKLASSKNIVLDGDVSGNATTDFSTDTVIQTSSKKLVGIGTCETSANVAEKIVTISNPKWTREVGSIISVKFTYSNTASNATLNVNGTGAASVYYNGVVYTSASSVVHGTANKYLMYMWDGTYWVWISMGWNPNSDTFPASYSSTAADTAAKVATHTGYTLLANSYDLITFTNTNTATSGVTLNINGRGAKPLFYNGSAISSSNYNFKAGTYLLFYDGTNYYIRDDNKITANITGNASSSDRLNTTIAGSTTQPVYFDGGIPKPISYTIAKSVPSNAIFTDTHYTTGLYVGATGAKSNSAQTNGNVYLKLYDNDTSRANLKIVGSGASTVASDASGNITISSTDTKYTLPTASNTALGGVKVDNSTISISSGVIKVNNNSHTHTIANITSLQSSLDAIQSSLNTKLNTNLKGAAGGLAELGSDGKVPANQLPSYVDDVIEGYAKTVNNALKFYTTSTGSTEISGESGKIYVDLNTNKTYRWSGSAFVVISETLALGTTSETAFRGDHGKVAYDHAAAKGNAYSSGLYKITTNAQGHVTGASAVTKTDITNLGIPAQDTNTTYTAGAGISLSGTTFSNAGVRSIATGTSNGTISVNTNGTTSNVLVYGLKSAAYTESSAYASASHNHDSSYLKLTGGTLSNSASDLDKPILILNNGNTSNAVGLEFNRGSNSNWRIVNNGGILQFKNNYTSSQGNYFDVLALNYNTGNATFKGPITAPSAIFSGTVKAVTFDGKATSAGKSDTATTATTATKLTAPKTLSVTGDVVGSVSSDLSDNISLNLKTYGKIIFGTCDTAAATAIKQITVKSGTPTLTDGTLLIVRFDYSNTAGSVKLKVGNLAEQSIAYASKSAYTGTASMVCGYAGRIICYVYDATLGLWIWVGCGYDTNSNTVPVPYCNTAAGTAAKVATSSGYVIKDGATFPLTITTANTAASALTMNINSTGAKAIYINGTASSTSNYTLPAGIYAVYYKDNIYHFRTDGVTPGRFQMADQLTTARKISLSGAVTGSGTFSGISDLTIATTVNHTHNYAGSSSASGAATSANKLNTNAGSTSQPVYFANGVPVAIGYTIEKNVPSNAIFTDTNTMRDPATAIPEKNGTAAVGTSIKYAREDHVHPLQTSVHESTYAQILKRDIVGSSGLTSALTAIPNNGLIYFGTVSYDNTGMPPTCTNNANGIIGFSRHVGDYRSFLCFDNKENIYYKMVTSSEEATNGEWKKVAFTDTVVDKALALTTSAGTSEIPVYFSGGMPVAIKSYNGNSATATKLSSAKTISIASNNGTSNGVAFDGSSNITLNLPSTITATLNGKASSADKLNANAGSATRPVYFNNGIPTVIQNIELDVNKDRIPNNVYELSNYVKGTMGGNDYWRIGGGATASNSGFLEISTADEGTEPIYVRQYANLYTAAPRRTLTLLDGSGNTGIPGNLTVTGTVTSGGGLTANTTLTVKGATTLSDTLSVTRETTLGNKLTVTGATTLNNTLSVASTSTFIGRTTHSGRVTIPSISTNWVGGKNGTYASIYISERQSDNGYHPYLAVTTNDGHVFNIGGTGNQVGFYGYYSSRTQTENGTDWKFYVDTSSGNWTCDKDITARKFIGNLTGNATTVTSTSTNPASWSEYRIPFVVSDGSQGLKVNDGIRYITQEGTASASGRGLLILGNSTNSGAAGNKFGQIRLYGTNVRCTDLNPSNNLTSDITITLPSKGGTLARTDDNVASATKVTTTNSNTRKVYLTGTDGAGTQSLYYDTGVYLSTTGGRLETGSISVGATSSQAGPATLQYDSSYKCIKFVFS